MNKKKIVLEFIKSHHLAVFATISSDGKPQAALMGYSQTENLELLFGTSKKTRKYKNLEQNENIAVVIGGEEHITLQYEGVVSELKGNGREMFEEKFFKKNPTARRFRNDPDEKYFIIKPTWIRYSDLTKPLPEIFEINF